MKDDQATIGALRAQVKRFIDERDWDQFHHPKDVAISLSLEAAELLEHFQWEAPRPVPVLRKDADLIAEVSDELADILHYVLTFANVLDIDLAQALERKMAKNAKKYPIAASKGNPIKYSRLARNHQTLTDDEI